MSAAQELETLARFLDEQREAVAWKLDGVGEEAARRSPVDSGTSLIGLVSHLGYVERYWFQDVLAGRDVAFPWSDEDPDADWRVEDGMTVASVLAFYAAEIDESRRIFTGLTDPDATVSHGSREYSVRRVLVHMIEETARHAGHADILREMIDGATGRSPS